MAKLSWDSFVKKHAGGICVFAAMTGVKVKPGTLAPDGRKLPTAYGLLLEALALLLKDDWTARSVSGTAHILLATPTDLAILQKRFQMGQINGRPQVAPCMQSHQFVYDGAVYSRLAKGLKYVPAS